LAVTSTQTRFIDFGLTTLAMCERTLARAIGQVKTSAQFYAHVPHRFECMMKLFARFVAPSTVIRAPATV